MNYRHAFHAGNFADCMKHALLVRLLAALAAKPRPFFVLDTHAGPGAVDLGAAEASRTLEWQGGIGRLRGAAPPAPLTSYLALAGTGATYPGSPALIRALLRPGDRLACCELHAEDHAALRRRFGADPQVGVHRRDGYAAIKALLPPPERRGLILIDPPFEAEDEFTRLVAALQTGLARFPSGVFAAWCPIKHRAPIRDFFAALADARLRDLIAAELWLRAPLDPTRLNGCGLLVANPPWGFAEDASLILDVLRDALAERGRGEGNAVLRLADE